MINEHHIPATQSAPGNIRSNGSDHVATAAMWMAAALVISPLIWILLDVIVRGVPHATPAFLVAAPENAGLAGGIGPIIVSTLLIVAVTMCVATPLSLAAAIAMTERQGPPSWLSRVVHQCLDMLAAVPSIVFGLFGNAFFCIGLGMGYSILAGGLTLACMVLPILIRTTERSILAVPMDYRHAAAALGLSRTTTLLQVILPAAAPAMAAGLVLSLGRALAETAALIFTAGYVTRMPESLTDSGRAMSVHIYDLAMNVPGGSSQAYATTASLIVLVLLLNGTAVLLTRLAGLETTESVRGHR